MSDSKSAAIRDEIAHLIDNKYSQYIDYDSYVVDLSQAEEVADAILAILAQEVKRARIDENQMGLNWQLAVKNGLEQQSENAQLTSTWKANELVISQFKTRIEQLERLG